MNKFKQTLKIIEEGLLKPMSDAEIKQIEDEKFKERINERVNYFLPKSTKNEDGSIDVHSNVDFYNLELENINNVQLKFNKVDGAFDCSDNRLSNLEGSPKEVNGNFHCSFNPLTSFEGCPKIVNGNFYCHDNRRYISFAKEKIKAICNVKGDIVV